MPPELVTALSGIQTPVSLIALAIVALLLLVGRVRQLPPALTKLGYVVAFLLAMMALTPMVLTFVTQMQSEQRNTVYALHIGIEAPPDTKVDLGEVKIIPDIDGTLKRNPSGGWELDIPASVLPKDRKIRLSAYIPEHQATEFIPISTDPVQHCVLHLQRKSKATFSGIVLDEDSQKAVPAARIDVIDTAQSCMANDGGVFSTSIDKVQGQMIDVHVEASGYEPFGGSLPCETGTRIRLSRSSRSGK